jgi:hypothetical protein
MSKRDRWIARLGLLLLLALHLDFWRPQRVVLYLGWVPEELVYRLAWVALVWVYLLFLCSRLGSRSTEQ